MNSKIDRIELLALLNKGLDFPLVLLVAPPGSGKSVLLEQWQKHLCQLTCPPKIMRFETSPKLNEGDVIFSLIFDALKSITPLWEASFFNLFKDDSQVDEVTLVEVFLEAFAQLEHDLVIIFDYFHHISSPRIHRMMNTLVSKLPSHVSILLSSRRYPQFSIAKLKLKGAVLLIDGNDLRINEEELLTLNQSIGGSQLETQRITTLLTQTEGWFVGTKLALLAHDKRGTEALDAFSGKQPELLNYFGHEVLNTLTPELRKFVLSTAICKSFNQELCETILDIDYTAARLEEITMQELFLSIDPERPEWYRYHPLLKDFLLKRLETEFGQVHISSLHYKVARYFLKAHDLRSALYHARQCKERLFYFQILEDACSEWFKRGELEFIIDSLNDLSVEDFHSHPKLITYQLYALSFSRRFNQAAYYLGLLGEVIAAENNNSRLKELLANEQFFTSLLAIFQSDSETLAPHIPLDLNSQSPEISAFASVFTSYMLMCKGELSAAFRLANQAKSTLKRMNHQFFESYANLLIILCDRYLGRGVEAIQLMNEVFTPIKHSKKTPLWVNLACGMMVVEYEQNRLEQSYQLGEQLIPLVSQSCVTEVVASVYLYQSRILHIEGKHSKAGRLLEQVERILSLGDYGRFNSLVIHEKMRQALSSNCTSSCELIYEKYALNEYAQKGAWHLSSYYDESQERRAMSCAYWLISKGRYKQASTLLEDIAKVLDKQCISSRALIARCNLCMIAYRQGNTGAAIGQLRKLISRYGLVCFSRTVFDESPGLELIFQHAIAERRVTLPSIFTDLFKTLMEADSGFEDLVQPSQVLTGKEFQIFELLSSGLSNAEISRQADIALSTTKWHLKNI